MKEPTDATLPAMSAEIIVQDREELIYLLCEAAEFEHTVMWRSGPHRICGGPRSRCGRDTWRPEAPPRARSLDYFG